MKIPFDIKYSQQIESGEYKVETRDGRVVHNIWRVKEPFYTNNRKAEVCALIDGEEDALVFFEGGRYLPTTKDTDSPFDLFIITPEEELTPLEDHLSTYLKNDFEYFSTKKWDEKKWNETMRIQAAELLKLAREQFIKDGYVIEKKAFRDAVENISDKHLAEMSVEYSIHCKVEDGTRHAIMNWKAFQKVAQKFIDIGKAEALKDLPRWRVELGDMEYAGYGIIGGGVASEENPRVYLKGHSIELYSLRKLPGFKEDEK